MFQALKERARDVFVSKEVKAERAALAPLQEYLDRNYKALKMARVYRQAGEGVFNLSLDQYKLLRRKILEESNEEVNWWRPSLCEIWEIGQEFQHESSHLLGELPADTALVRGFWFNFASNGFYFECVDLDDGNSRKYFDFKSNGAKRRFMKRFAYRNFVHHDILPDEAERWVDKTKNPKGFIAFISDTGNSFLIEHIVALWARRIYSSRPLK